MEDRDTAHRRSELDKPIKTVSRSMSRSDSRPFSLNEVTDTVAVSQIISRTQRSKAAKAYKTPFAKERHPTVFESPPPLVGKFVEIVPSFLQHPPFGFLCLI